MIITSFFMVSSEKNCLQSGYSKPPTGDTIVNCRQFVETLIHYMNLYGFKSVTYYMQIHSRCQDILKKRGVQPEPYP